MGKTVAQKIIADHLLSGEMVPGKEIAIKIDQTLMQDATGTMVMLELEAMGTKEVKTEVSCQYVDHNILQTDFKNADDHVFLQSACRKFGIHFSRAGNGVSHPVHMENFEIPGKTLLGSDSHTCAGGGMGMLAIGAGGLEVALATIGEAFYVKMPQIMGIKLTHKLPDWVSAKDIILEMLRRHDVDGGVGKIIEYYGPGLEGLTAMDRHVIANMGAELGATGTVFPSDAITREFLRKQKREKDWVELKADEDAKYDLHDEIDLSKLEPLIACPTSPGNVVPVSQVAGKPVYQTMVGSSANPGMRDFAIAAMIVKGKKLHPRVSFDIIPSSRQTLQNLAHQGQLEMLIASGARIHQAGCNGCIGMGQAPPTGKISLRTVPRNFPGRSGTKNDQVYLCSPETAAAATLTGEITDPRTLDMPYPKYEEPSELILNEDAVLVPPKEGKTCELEMGPNIKPLPKFAPLEDHIKGPVLLKMGDNVSTDEILPAGTKVLPFRSNIPEISKFTFSQIDESFYDRAMPLQKSGSLLVGGSNYGQGSSREHAAIAPRYLGIRAVIAKSYARIHRKNLINFGIPPLEFVNEKDHDGIEQEDILEIENVLEQLKSRGPIIVKNTTKRTSFETKNTLSDKEMREVIAGGLINVFLTKQKSS
ncbi:MAG: Homoaconitase large subunit [Chlamydiae bacterium]|nr:Homoaconitase large subunit [Chlamydiota bacterium]